MILIVGGAYAGKREVASAFGYEPSAMADGELNGAPVLLNLHALIAKCGGDTEGLLPVLLEKEIITCNEIGAGVVPVDPAERALREAIGRLCVELAREAAVVVRVVAGIPVAIKGELP